MSDVLPPRAGVCETHTAILFFAGGRVHKLKKPVSLGFLDYTTVAARRTACEREVALNRRFSPDVYLGLGELREPGSGDPEPLVVMRRMPADRRLSHLVREGADVDDVLRSVARQLAAWHARAPRGPQVDAQGTRDALSARWEDSFRQVRELTEDGDLPDGLPEVERLVRRYLAGRELLFDARIEQGRVVDGHGDLLAEDIFCLDDGPRLLDCLEFDDHLRYVDGLDDAAFLAMDLEQLDAPQAAAFFLARYGEFSGDPAPPSLWHHYVAYRAFVRAKVSLIQARQGAPGAEAAFRRLLSTTLRHLRAAAVGLTLVGGMPGSGKSTLAGALADRLGVTLLSSDRLRKQLAGIPATGPPRQGTARASTHRSGRRGRTRRCSTTRPRCCPPGSPSSWTPRGPTRLSGTPPCASPNGPAPTWSPCTATCRTTWPRRASTRARRGPRTQTRPSPRRCGARNRPGRRPPRSTPGVP